MSLRALDDWGAHFVLAAANKTPLNKEWQETPATLEEAHRHEASGGLVGLIPGKSDLAVVDVDEGAPAALMRAWQPLAKVNTPSGGCHLLYARPDEGMGNRKFEAYGCKGDIRCDKGYVVVWDRGAWSEAMVSIQSGDGVFAHPFPDDLFEEAEAERSPEDTPQLPLDDEDTVRTKHVLRWARPILERLENCEEGGRNEELNRSAYAIARKCGAHGKVDSEVLAEKIWEAAEACGLPSHEIKATLESAWKAGFATPLRMKKMPRPEREPPDRDGADPPAEAEKSERPQFYKTARGLAEALEKLGYEYRHNIRSDRTEYNFKDRGWENSTDRLTSNIREAMARHFHTMKGSPYDWPETAYHDKLNALLYHREMDPVLLWMENDIPEWDGVKRLDMLLTDIFHAEPNALNQWSSRYLVLGCIQRTYNPGCKLDEFPVLVGGQGIGKSTFATSHLPPDQVSRWFTDHISLSDKPKEQVEALQGRLIVELAELTGNTKPQLDRLKAFLTRTDDGSIRLAWRRDATAMPRRFVFIGTSNDAPAPNDPTGNRRFVPVDLQPADQPIEEHFSAETEDGTTARRQLWAEGLVRYRAGERANLPRELKSEAEAAAERHRYADEAMENVVARLMEYPSWSSRSSTFLMRKADLLGKTEIPTPRDQSRFVKALKHHAWTQGRVEGRRVWIQPGQEKAPHTQQTLDMGGSEDS